MESSGGNGEALSQRLGNLVLGVAVTVAMTALFLSGCDFATGIATLRVAPHDAAKMNSKPAPAKL